MKRPKTRIICAVLTIALFIIAVICSSGTSRAEKSRLTGSGSFVFKSGGQEAAFYAEDIEYLQRELITLFQEVEGQENE